MNLNRDGQNQLKNELNLVLKITVLKKYINMIQMVVLLKNGLVKKNVKENQDLIRQELMLVVKVEIKQLLIFNGLMNIKVKKLKLFLKVKIKMMVIQILKIPDIKRNKNEIFKFSKY